MPMAPDERPPRRRLGYGRQFIDAEDIEAVADVLKSDFLTQGPQLEVFEEELARTTGAPHVVSVANGTAALHVAYAAFDVGPGDTFLTTANTFLGTASAGVLCGARAEFLDIDLATGNMAIDALARRLEVGPAVRAVTAVHFAGLPVDMERVIELKRRHGFLLFEDAAHALGARYAVEGRMWRVGEHPEIDACCLSFHPVKHVTTGEGGAVLTSNAAAARRLRRLRSHGIDLEADEKPLGWEGERPAWFRPMVELGFNYRMSELHAALGVSQLTKLKAFLARRREIAAIYRDRLRGFHVPDRGDIGREHAWHLFVVRVDQGRDELMAYLAEQGIFTQLHYYPVPLQPYFRSRYGVRRFPNAEEHARTALSLPIHTGLAVEEQGEVIDALNAWARG
ncbi:MAG: DegT/DnrJ/EryC1/StrS family aminotransferase [Planctomycetota bacterium]